MAASLHAYGVKIPCHRSVRNSRFRSNVLNPLNWLRFSDSMALNSRLFRAAIGDSSRRRAMKKLVKVGGNKGRVEAVLKEELEKRFSDGDAEDFTCVMKFGGSSVASAERMREIADLILTFPEERPVVVLSAMGKTTNKLLVAGEKAVSCGVSNASEIEELSFVGELHLRTVDELQVDRSVISG